MIVFVTDELPRPGSAGHLAYNHAVLSWLRNQGHEVRILLTGARLDTPLAYYGLAPVGGPRVKSVGPYVAALSPPDAGRILARAALRALPRAAGEKLRRRGNGADAVLGAFPAARDIRWCAREVARLRPDAVLVDTIFRAPLLAEPELDGVNSVILTHDVFHRRARALAAAGYAVKPEGLTREKEAALLGAARYAAAIQRDEAAVLTEMCPGLEVFTAPMPALPRPRPVEMIQIPGRLVFVGSDSLPNLDGLRWFFADVWPHLRGSGVTLDLVGDCGTAMRRLPQGVKAVGRVPDLAPVLHRASLAVSPLRTGSGLKIKLLDYARHGLFTIATPPSAAGFAQGQAVPFAVAGSAAMFARAVLRHAESPPGQEAGLAYVAKYYGPARSFAGLNAALGREKAAATS